MRQQLADGWHNLQYGVAFALFLRRGAKAVRSGLDQLLWLLLFSLLLQVAVDHINHRPDPAFNHYAFATFGLEFLLFALSSYLLAVVLQRRDAILPMLTIFTSTALVLALAQLAVVQLSAGLMEVNPDGQPLLSALYTGWILLIALRAALTAFSLQPRRRTVAVALPLLLLCWLMPLKMAEWDSSFWLAGPGGGEDIYAPYRRMDAEALLYAQPRMVAEALQRLAPQRPGVADLYFVSFGGYAYQDVFMKEARYAQQIMDQRFDTRGHSLELVNNLQSREVLPLATASNLHAVLQQLGAAMDREEDMLMLYLTSHGSEQHELAVEFWPLPLNDITPSRLRQMLDEAGIKWRVVVVSSCYSGGFVEALKDEYTLVATAAAADRQSFGCGNDDDFTYFGEALFRDALQHGGSLPQALRQTRQAIAAREQREQLEPSLPQLYIAPRLEQKLGQMTELAHVMECGATDTAVAAVGC